MITTELKDALGRTIEIGPAAYVEVGRGSISARETYIVGARGAKVVCLHTRWLSKEEKESLIRDYLEGKFTEAELKKVSKTQVPTRIIMLKGG
jgi:uncharacterized protein (DUF1786 family)